MSPAPIGHRAISASAGAGKTYQLTNRFIRLLHGFGAPERIVALTFTRAAAGEFFDRIVEKLAAAAADEERAVKLARECGIDAGPRRFGDLLRLLLERMDRLNLQTLDSFFFRIVSAFPLELGLSGSVQLLDETSAPRARAEVRDQLVHRRRRLDRAMEAFRQAFAQATHGVETRSVDRVVARFIDALYPLFLEAPDAERWGAESAIWPEGCPWTSREIDMGEACDRFLANLPAGLGRSQRNQLEKMAEAARAHRQGDPIRQALLERALATWPAPARGSVQLTAGNGENKEFTLEGPACEALADIIRALVHTELRAKLQTTRGVHAILHAYNEVYDRAVRRAGRLAFEDLTRLLAPEASPALGARPDPIRRERVDYRLDGRFDHWLIDEFQDTSRSQWRVLERLVDEVLQDASGERSFFYVGDTKQCLYLWRQSDDRLFHEIAERYGPDHLPVEPLARSWRSATPVLAAVNELFGDLPRVAEQFGEGAADRWRAAWQPHEASPATADLAGHAAWLMPEPEEERDAFAVAADLIDALRPLERGLSCGVLTRTNAEANDLAGFIAARGGPPAHSGSALFPARDNAAGAGLLALVQLAAHPGDRFAAGHLRMLDPEGGLLRFAREFRRIAAEHGAEAAVREAAGALLAAAPDEHAFHRERLDHLIEAARAFEEEDALGLDALRGFLAEYSAGAYKPRDAVIVQTIHQAKGMEYDVVLALVNETQTSLNLDRGIAARRDASGDVRWVLEPTKKGLMQLDPELDRLVAEAESQGGFDALCRLYVAMTRARQGLYLVSDPPAQAPQRGSLLRFLGESFGDDPKSPSVDRNAIAGVPFPVVWSVGDPAWVESAETPPEEPATVETAGPRDASPEFAPAARRLRLQRPSAAESDPVPARRLFETRSAASDFGARVHRVFEAIEWVPDDAGEDWTPGDSRLADDERACLRACLRDPDIRGLLREPEGPAKLWRERAFALAEDDRLISGVFDRAVVELDAAGAPARAVVADFKTDAATDEASLRSAVERHRPQLLVYRRALARLTALPEDRIDLRLVFTRCPCVRTVD